MIKDKILWAEHICDAFTPLLPDEVGLLVLSFRKDSNGEWRTNLGTNLQKDSIPGVLMETAEKVQEELDNERA